MGNKLDANDTRLPITLLTGFLGAGKTTLLNAIIPQSTGPKIAVIVNEFGEAGLDHDLIETVDEEVVLMKSGCLCCSILGDLSRTLQDLAARKQESRSRRIVERFWIRIGANIAISMATAAWTMS